MIDRSHHVLQPAARQLDCPAPRSRLPPPFHRWPAGWFLSEAYKYIFSRPECFFILCFVLDCFSFRAENTPSHLQIHGCALSNEELSNSEPVAAATLFRRSYAAAGPSDRRVEHVSLNVLALISSRRCRPKRENEKTRPAKFKNIPRKKATDENPPRITHQKKGKPRFFSAPPVIHSQEQSTQTTAARASVPRGARRSA